MTTSTQVTCPVCGSSFYLLGGRFPPHTFKGDPCPMSGREPQEWPPAGEHPLDTKARAEAVASLANSAITLPESALAGVGAMDTPPDKKRKPRSDKGRKRTRQAEAVVQVTAKPKAKRAAPAPWTYTVAVVYKVYPDENSANVGMAKTLETLINPNPAPILIAGRVLLTEYEPASAIPATVKVVR